jgi:hypothetical protein
VAVVAAGLLALAKVVAVVVAVDLPAKAAIGLLTKEAAVVVGNITLLQGVKVYQ